MPVAPGGQLPGVNVHVGRRLSPPRRELLPVRRGIFSVLRAICVLRCEFPTSGIVRDGIIVMDLRRKLSHGIVIQHNLVFL